MVSSGGGGLPENILDSATGGSSPAGLGSLLRSRVATLRHALELVSFAAFCGIR